MKQMLMWVVALLLVFAMAITTAAEDAENLSNEQKLDPSIFEVPELEELYSTYPCASCMDSFYLGISHYCKDGITFFHGSGKMTAKIEETCFDVGSVGEPVVVFWNGVQNLVKDLFKYWENGTHDVYIPDSVKEIDEECFVEGSHITIHFTKNNAVALAYAQNRGMAFEVMDGERVSGDVNFDKEIDMKDTLSLRKSIASLPAAVEIYSTDLNADGSTDMKDVLTLRKQIATAA